MQTIKPEDHDKRDANRDPISGAPGAHPIGTGIGAAAGGMAAGAAAGTVAGPLGTLAGAAIGAVVGGLAGKAVGEMVDPTAEDTYWRTKYSDESYYQSGMTYDDYAPAYRTGFNGRSQHAGRKFDEVEDNLESSYNSAKGASPLSWEKAKHATRAAWDRVDHATR
jgi:phage tail tape-measure protein